jgi:hypothetical protein
MGKYDLTELQLKARRALQYHADEYAEILVLCAGDEFALIEVECVLAFSGYTPPKFMMKWASGAFDV